MSEYPQLQFYIDGQWHGAHGRRTRTVVNPATTAVLGELPLVETADLERSLHATEVAFRRWKHSSTPERTGVLKGAARVIRERREYIARLTTMEEGKPLPEAREEVESAAQVLEYYAEECSRSYGRALVRPTGTRFLVVKEPVGPVAALTPWNFPVSGPTAKLAAAIAAGCSVILKPAEETPAPAIEIVRALADAGLPADVCQLVFGVPDEVSRHLLASPVIRKLSFTGSTVVGKHLLALAAATVKRTTMELGGHAPVIVCDDADLDRAVDLLVRAKFRNAGQACVAPTRFYVQRDIYANFVSAFTERARRIRVGDGLEAHHEMGPLANPRRLQAMEAFIDDALRHGAKLQFGGMHGGGEGFFWAPTVLTEVPVEARIMNEEPFGPVASMVPFAHIDEALEQANRLPYGLAAYAFTESGKRAMVIADALEAGAVGINSASIAAPDAPFGGVKQSGHGAQEGPEGLDAYLVTKTIHQV